MVKKALKITLLWWALVGGTALVSCRKQPEVRKKPTGTEVDKTPATSDSGEIVAEEAGSWERGGVNAPVQIELFLSALAQREEVWGKIINLSLERPDLFRTVVYFVPTMYPDTSLLAVRAHCLAKKRIPISRLMSLGIEASYDSVSGPWEFCRRATVKELASYKKEMEKGVALFNRERMGMIPSMRAVSMRGTAEISQEVLPEPPEMTLNKLWEMAEPLPPVFDPKTGKSVSVP